MSVFHGHKYHKPPNFMFPYFAFYTSLCTCCTVWAKPPKENVSRILNILAFYATFMWFP